MSSLIRFSLSKWPRSDRHQSSLPSDQLHLRWQAGVSGQNNQLHIFYDAGCGQTWSGWFVACKAPDLERQWNLQDAASGNCCNYVRFTNTSELQFGTYEMPWKWRNDWAYSGPDTLTLSVCQLPGSFSEAPTPGPESDTETAPNSFTSWPSSFSLLAAVTAVTVMAFLAFEYPQRRMKKALGSSSGYLAFNERLTQGLTINASRLSRNREAADRHEFSDISFRARHAMAER